MSTSDPTEEELRAAYEEEIKRIRVEHVLIETVVTLINLGMRRTGLMPGTEGERDAGQVQLAIESVRAVLPLVESVAPEETAQIRQALSQLQLGYVRIGGQGGQPAGPTVTTTAAPDAAQAAPAPVAPAAASGAPESDAPGPAPADPEGPEGKPGEAGPAQRSGRLWVPGQ
jgi:hypothetical protein